MSSSEASTQPTSIEGRIRSFGRALTIAELADILSIAPLTLFRWCKAKRVPHYRLGKTVRFSPHTTLLWLEQREVVPNWFKPEERTA